MKRLCAAVTVTVTLCLFVLFVTREPASTATRSQVPRGEQAAPVGPDPARQSNQSTDPPTASGTTTASSTMEPTSTTRTETESTPESSTTPTTTTTSSTIVTTTSFTETTSVVSAYTTTSASSAPVTTTPSAESSNLNEPTSSATPPFGTTTPPVQAFLSAPPTPPWLARQQQSPGSLVERDAATARSTLAAVSVRPTEPPTAFEPDALAPTPPRTPGECLSPCSPSSAAVWRPPHSRWP